MKRYISYLACVLAVVFAASCIKVEMNHYTHQSVAKLVLKNTELVETRAAGVGSLNENLIANVQCFFSVDSSSVVYRTGVVQVDKSDSGEGVELALDIPADLLEDLFPSGDTCYLYVVANAPAVSSEADSFDEIKATAISLAADGTAQPSFVMDGVAIVTKNADNSLSGSVDLTRAAAKIEVEVRIQNQIVIGEGEEAVTWTPDLETVDGVKITYNNGVTASKLSALATDAATRAPYARTTSPFNFTEGTSYATGTLKMPFYSYPSKWNDSKDANAAHILLEIPWKKAGDTKYATYRYQIPVNFDLNNEIVRNNIYKLRIDVGILGALQGEVELTPSYYVVDWKTMNINTELSRPQYLVVDQNHVVMNNVEEFSVGYSSSDEVGVKIIETTVHDWEYKTVNNKRVVDSGAAYPTDNVRLENGKIVYSHQLDNTRDDGEYDFLKQEITVRIYHKTTTQTTAQNATIYEDITFVQYPAMYINDVISSSTNNVFVNKNQSSNTNATQWWHKNSGVGPNMTDNLYTVYVSAFDTSTSSYQICDPRESSNSEVFKFYQIGGESNGNATTEVATATDDAQSNQLIGYRATISGTPSDNLVAPSFIIASGYSAYNGQRTNLYSDTSAKYRCAAYQEDGYPAGRWRLPTPAELQVIGKLCAEGKLASVFYPGYTYVSSSGIYEYDEDAATFNKVNNAASRSVRCVYDIWYWEDVCQNKSQFVWGAEGNVAALKASDNYDTFFKSVE